MEKPACLCDALAAGQRPRAHGPGRFSWARGSTPRAAADDGAAPHLEAMKELGIPRLLDAHSHWFPENVERKIWSYFDDHYWPVTYRCSHQERRAWMGRNGVEHYTVLTYAHRPGMAEWLNEWVARFADDAPEALPCGTFYPEPEAGRVVRRCIEEYGFRGFKLHLQVSAIDPTDSRLDAAIEQVAHAGLPLVMHIGNGPAAGPYNSPIYLERLLARHPHLKVVVAHMGAFEFEAYLAIAEQRENVYLDTTMVFVGYDACGQYPPALLGRLQNIAGQVLFGSDFPVIPYPLSHAVEGILALPFSAEQKRGILAENAAALFGANAP